MGQDEMRGAFPRSLCQSKEPRGRCRNRRTVVVASGRRCPFTSWACRQGLCVSSGKQPGCRSVTLLPIRVGVRGGLRTPRQRRTRINTSQTLVRGIGVGEGGTQTLGGKLGGLVVDGWVERLSLSPVLVHTYTPLPIGCSGRIRSSLGIINDANIEQ